MLDTIAGLPIHPLIVHATVVAVPAAALTVLLAAVWPRFRRWAGWLPLGLSAACVALVPLSTSSGESLEDRVAETALVERHAELGEGLLVWVVLLVLAAAALQVRDRLARRASTSPGTPVAAGEVRPAPRRTAGLVATVMVVLLAAAGVGGTVVQTVLIGHSGAQAAWHDLPAPAGAGGGGDDD